MMMSLFGAWLVYLLSATLLILLSCHLMLRFLGRIPRALLAALLVLLLTPCPTDATLQHVGPATVTLLFEVLAHSRIGMLRALLPLAVMATLAAVILAWVLPRRQPDA